MSETLTKEKTTKKPVTREVRSRRKRFNEYEDFQNWLTGLGCVAAPTVHVNGPSHSTAVVTVDFGTPLNETMKLTPEQNADLIGYIRTLTRSLYRERDVSVRVQSDTSAGIWWSSVG